MLNKRLVHVWKENVTVNTGIGVLQTFTYQYNNVWNKSMPTLSLYFV